MGQSPDSKFYNYDKIGLPFYQGKTDFGRLNPTPKMWCSKSKKEAKPNDILISVRAPVGDLNINIEQSCIGRGLAAITCKNDVDMMYIYYHLKYLKPQLKHISTGSTFESINRSQLENLNINYKSYAEQIKISNILQVVQRQIDVKENLLRLYDLLIKSRFVE
ncbi:MAG: restriction endonuclease subunit S, partial [Clostridium sp.]|nr:restriction endonuclease subunit S [Clostridium sp.]